MTLTPIERGSIFKSDNPDFNYKAAQKVYDLIMKMDEEEAREFCYHVANDMVEETIEKNLPVLQRHLNKVISKRVEVLKRATMRAAAKDTDGAVEFAKALSEISKATPYDYGYRFKESDFSRDPGTGRFRAKVTTSQVKPIKGRTAESMGLPHGKDVEGLPPRRAAAYQDQYRQLTNFLGAVHASSRNPGDSDVIAHIRNKHNGQVYTVTTSSTRPDPKMWDPKHEDLVGLDARPNALTAGGAYFGLSTSLGADGSKQRYETMRGINAVDSGFGSFEQDWNQQVDGRDSNARLYGRLSAGSKIVGEIAPAGSKVQLAARMAQFVGDHGSEAEAVFGPSARKTAYRYRGTSKTPDKVVVGAVDRAMRDAKLATANDPYRNTPEGKKANLKRPQELSPVQMAAARISAERRAPTWEERANGRAVAVEYLSRRIPSQKLYDLQLASGNTPPSEGVIIDKDGKVVDQAVGYGDDHYLPFNLRKLKGLKGGEYIRNRSVGGLTSEDVYTGLMSGARQVTVVSRSGVFTMEFEQDFTGGRRYNDKARRMTRRYEQLLDAVQSEQVDRMSLNPEIREAIKTEVMEEMGGYAPRKDIQTEINRRVDEFKSSPELSDHDERLARFIATQRAQGSQGKDADDFMGDVMNELAAEKEYKYRLNGEGYKAALIALQEQFPYYIKDANAVPRRHMDRMETSLDRGYVEPGRNRPTYAAAGLFGNAKRNPTMVGGKFSASEADYQGGRGSGGPRRGAPSPDGPAPFDAKNFQLNPTGEQKKSVKSVVAERRAAQNYAEAAVSVQAVLKDRIEPNEEEAKLLNLTPEELAQPENQAKFDSLVSRAVSANVRLGEAGAAYKVAAGHVGRKEYGADVAGVWGDKPFAFSGAAYETGADLSARMAEMKKIDSGGVRHDKPLSEMNEAELKDEYNVLKEMRTFLGQGPDDLPAMDRVELLRDLQVVRNSPVVTRLVSDPKQITAQLETVHRMRALKDGQGPEGTMRQESGDIVIRNAPVTAEEKLRPQGRVSTLISEFEKAAQYYADLGNDNAADTLYIAAQALHDERQRVKSHEDVEDLRGGVFGGADTVKEAERLTMEMYADKRKSQ